jgi:hypothetical protein
VYFVEKIKMGGNVLKSGCRRISDLPISQQQRCMEAQTLTLSSRPERTRISCHAALDRAACAAFRKESRMKIADATNLDRKSGEVEWSDLRLLSVHPI